MKGLIDFFVDRYRTTLTMMFLVLTLGMYSYSQIPNASEPDIDVPFVIVSTFYEGVSPEDAERLISRPIEKRLLTSTGKSLFSIGLAISLSASSGETPS